MSKLRTHYDNLKVARNAPLEVIRAAYRTLSQKYHPDRNTNTPDAEKIMKTLNTAYQTLSNPELRKDHDLWIALQEKSSKTTEKNTQPEHSSEKKYFIFVENEVINKQINKIFLLVSDGLSDQVITDIFCREKVVNFKENSYRWTTELIKKIRLDFRLDSKNPKTFNSFKKNQENSDYDKENVNIGSPDTKWRIQKIPFIINDWLPEIALRFLITYAWSLVLFILYFTVGVRFDPDPLVAEVIYESIFGIIMGCALLSLLPGFIAMAIKTNKKIIYVPISLLVLYSIMVIYII